MTIHLIAYTSRSGSGIAQVRTSRSRPSWSQCAAAIPGYVTGEYLGPAPTYTLRYVTPDGETVFADRDHSAIETLAAALMRECDAVTVTDIAVLDFRGLDVTFDFVAFRAR